MAETLKTDREIYALKPQPGRYERAVSKARGLSLIVYPNGCKAFVVRYVGEGGARRRLPIGEYPSLSLVDARLKAAAVHLEIRGGADPAAERAVARAEIRMGERFCDLAEGYWKAAAIGLHGGRKRPLKPETIQRQQGVWKINIAPVLGERRYRDFRRADMRRFMEGFVIEGRLSPASIACIGDVVRAFFAYALHQDLVEANPTIGLTSPITPQSRTRLVSDDALRAMLASLVDASNSALGREDPHARMGAHMALGVRFMILTLTRRTECSGARWPEIDRTARTWTIPGTRTKNGRSHVVPLSDQAFDVLAEALTLPGASENGFVFPSPLDASAHLDPHAVTRAVNRLCGRLNLPLASPHDFRRTGATTLTNEAYGIRRFIVGKVLGHTAHEGPAVTSIYDRNEYLADKREALNAWGRHVAGLMPPPAAQRELRPRRTHLRLVHSG